MITNAEKSSYDVRRLQRTTTNLIKDSSGSYLAQSETIQQSNQWHPQLLVLRKPFSIRTESNLINDSCATRILHPTSELTRTVSRHVKARPRARPRFQSNR
ncbi:hypothetical protein RHMOL_RhmolUnG0005900 [Rhododendron molle]|nr:hypothetical protein RHMOL_RhmolUnG0005900 [Rhododendron molle]